MPRPIATDFLHSMRFQVSAQTATNTLYLNPSLETGDTRPQAGFSACTTPEVSAEAVEYREGIFVYARKFPGNPTTSDVTLSRGVARNDSTFWDWMRIVVEGTGLPGDYRADVTIKHFHRAEALQKGVAGAAGNPQDATAGQTNTNIDTDTPARQYILYQAFPIRHKVAADLDATASEISIMELDVAYEYFDVIGTA
jgi:phage tail-like protein